MNRLGVLIIAVMSLGIFSQAYAQEKSINMIESLSIEQDIISLEGRITELIKRALKSTIFRGYGSFISY